MFQTGDIVEGRVSGITKFGAFVALPEGKSGLVHISEITNSFVSDVNNFLKLGDTVRVRVMNISDEGKINLSIKRAVEEMPAAPQVRKPQRTEQRVREETRAPMMAQEALRAEEKSADAEFEDKLKRFMQMSDSKLADNKMYADHRSRSRRR